MCGINQLADSTPPSASLSLPTVQTDGDSRSTPVEDEEISEYICQYCGSENQIRITGPWPNGHHAKIRCSECNLFLKWEEVAVGDNARVPQEAIVS